MSLGDALAGLGQTDREDLQKAFPYSESEEFMGKAAARIAGLAKAGGWRRSRKTGSGSIRRPSRSTGLTKKKGFPTPSGKFEIFSPRLQERGFPALPSYNPHQSPSGDERERFSS